MKRTVLIHPILYTVVSVLFLYIRISTTISPLEMLRSLLGMIVFLLVISFFVFRVSRSAEEAGIFLSLFVFAFYFERSIFLPVFSLTIIVLAVYFVIKKLSKTKVSMRQVTLLLNLLSFALFLGGGAKLIQLLSDVPFEYYQRIFSIDKHPLLTDITIREENPDIYYIILDGYGREDVLEELYSFDNSSFIAALETREFIVPAQSRSNYPKTIFSIASTLNMDYFQNFAPDLDRSYFWWLLEPMIDHSQTRMLLEDMGYESIAFAVNWTITDNKSVDFYYSPDKLNISEFENYILANTLMGVFRPLLDKIAYIPSSYDAHRELINYDLETLPEIAKKTGDYFVYAHLLVPHPPFVFDEDGNPINPDVKFSLNDDDSFTKEEQRVKKYTGGYVGQVQYLNDELIPMLDEIIANSSTPPIIILQADHGPGMFVDFSSSEKTCLQERFSPFAAYYLPGVDGGAVPEDITAVNLFRIIFNEYFGADLPLLDNEYYFSKDPVYLYGMDMIPLENIEQDCVR